MCVCVFFFCFFLFACFFLCVFFFVFFLGGGVFFVCLFFGVFFVLFLLFFFWGGCSWPDSDTALVHVH